jgi:hypothetical protein
MATIPTDDPWVPLRILGLGAEPDDRIEADVFLLTEDEPDLLAGGTGLTLDRSVKANRPLLDDLRSDTGMEWLPRRMWLTYLTLDAPASELDYDLAVSAAPGAAADFADTGVSRPESLPVGTDHPALPTWPIFAGVGAGVLTLAAGRAWARRHRLDPGGAGT